MNFGRRPVPDLVPGDVFEWCDRPVRLLSVGPPPHRDRGIPARRSVRLTVLDLTDNQERCLSYELTENVRVPS